MPLFFWLLDIVIINAHLLALLAYQVMGLHPPVWIKNHRWFRLRLAWLLFIAGALLVDKDLSANITKRAKGTPAKPPKASTTPTKSPARYSVINKNFKLPELRLYDIVNHKDSVPRSDVSRE